MRLGVGARLLGAHLILSAIVIGAVQAVLGPALRSQLTEELDGRLEQAARGLAASLERGVVPGDAAGRIAAVTGFRMSVIDAATGASIAESSDAPGRDPAGVEVADPRHGMPGQPATRADPAGEPTRYRALPVAGGLVARAAAPLSILEGPLSTGRRALLLAGAIGLLLAAALGFAASRVADRAVGTLTRAARRMADGDLTGPSPRGPGELGDLAVALDRMAAQLGQQLSRLTAERDLLDAVLSAMAEAVLVLRPDGSILLANEAARALLAIPRAAQERPLIETVRFPPLHDAVRRASAGETATFELLLPGPPRRELAGRAAPLPRGGEAAVALVVRDVTELRRLEGMRRDFVASASHELRTPVAAIRGFAETLASGALADRPAAERFVAGLARQAERLSALIDDLLDLSRIESGGMRLTAERVPLAPALRRILDPLREPAARKQLSLELRPLDGALAVDVDPRALEMILGNLLDNAIKYTPEGGRVSVSAVAMDGGVRIEVADTGPGIEPQHLPRIFERFYRVDGGRSREVGGTGLGLAIAKHTAQQSGGDVGVESEVGAGSRFWVRLPRAPEEAELATSGA